jgi:sugar/nucleoside kinase (ribokinase family)
MPSVGVVGSLVWDEIHGRDPAAPPVEEWGGIAYALAGFEAALPPDWQLVPLVKVGRDLAPRAGAFLRTLSRVPAGSRLAEVTAANNRVVLRYETSERRCERMSGGVPPWTWDELGPMVRDLDALYVNFISGFELPLGTALALRQAFRGPVYADLHSLLLGMGPDGMRALRPLPDAPSWFGCFDVVQLNEDEMLQLAEDPLGAADAALGAGVSALLVTLGRRGAVYVAAPGFERLADRGRAAGGRMVRTARVDAPAVEALDPTGCGDVFGATVFSALLEGRTLEDATAAGTVAAARNAAFQGATGLAGHLRGTLVGP